MRTFYRCNLFGVAYKNVVVLRVNNFVIKKVVFLTLYNQ